MGGWEHEMLMSKLCEWDIITLILNMEYFGVCREVARNSEGIHCDLADMFWYILGIMQGRYAV